MGAGMCIGMGTPCVHKAAAGAWLGRGYWGGVAISLGWSDGVWAWWAAGEQGEQAKFQKCLGVSGFGVWEQGEQGEQAFLQKWQTPLLWWGTRGTRGTRKK